MKSLYTAAVIVLSILLIVLFALTRINRKAEPDVLTIPHIGSVQILNGCGTPGAGQVIRDLLRKKGFDVKDVENAPDWNYRETIVASRVKDMETANLIGRALKCDNVILLRNDAKFFDVTVFVGQDYTQLAEAAGTR